MTRVLKRPMFRIGGPANEGITSGLAPRQGYAEPGSVQPMSGMEKDYLEAKAIRDKYAPTRGRGDLSQFLIDFGLNVASATPSGSILSTAAASAKDPYARFTAKKEARLADEDKFTRAMIGDIYEQREKTKRAEIEARGVGKKQYEYAAQYKDYQDLISQERKVKEQIAKVQEDRENMPGNLPTTVIDSQIKRLEDDLKYIMEKKSMFQEQEKDEQRQIILKNIPEYYTFEDLRIYDETGKLPEDQATGGRVGYATAGQVIPGEMPRTSQADVIQSMSFEDLRSRLPSTITNDVIQLLANSQEALVEFSNIQTESDIRSFNRKYEVNLVLPAEA